MFMFDIMSVFVPVMFLLVFGIIIGSIVQNFKKQRKNDAAPRINSAATVVTKRTKVWGDHSRTDYYATFQFASGDRMEMHMTGQEYGMLVEGDRGDLTFQGTRYLGFVRK